MDFDYLRKLFAYNHWANREVVAGLRAVPDPPSRSVRLMAHVLGAELLWLNRLLPKQKPPEVWPEMTLPEATQFAEQMPPAWDKYLKELRPEGLSRAVTYRNSKGEQWTNTVEDILMHVVFHSAYHRGQIATDMRANRLVPAYTDFIHGVRQRLVSE